MNMDDSIKIESIVDMEYVVNQLPNEVKYVAVYITDYRQENGIIIPGLNADKLKLYKYTKCFEKRKNMYPVCWFVPGYIYLEEPIDNQKEYILVNNRKNKRWYFYPDIFDEIRDKMPNDFYGKSGIYLFDRFHIDNYEFIPVSYKEQLIVPLSDARLFQMKKKRNILKTPLQYIKSNLEKELQSKFNEIEKTENNSLSLQTKHVNYQKQKISIKRVEE